MGNLDVHFGVVEAYYGRSWSYSSREACIQIYPSLGIANYLYAPKSDKRLRSEWRQPWADIEFDSLYGLFDRVNSTGLRTGVGLSPLGLQQLASPRDRQALKAKIEQINGLGCYWLGIFFDDMPSAGHSMAKWQLEIIEFIMASSCAEKFVICPTFYTTDLLLDRLFGNRPENYWRELGENLPVEVDFFWTGEQVCSQTYSRDNLAFIADQFKRLPILWDNYPVNDGEKNSQFLRLKPFTDRPGWLNQYTAGHFANPMNQACLSLLPLSTLSKSYGAQVKQLNQDWQQAAMQLCPDFALNLWEDCDTFQYRGLDKLTPEERSQLKERYQDSASVYAREVCEWLNGEYWFDPACLTG